MNPIPFNRPGFVGRELEYVTQAVTSGHISGDGSFTRRVQAFIEQELGVRRVLLATSCTDALEMAGLLLDLKPGDEFIVPSFTFVSTANAFVLRGARPVFVDVRADTLNIDERLVERAIGPKTRAIVVVHYAGVGCEMEILGEIALRHNLPLIEDNAHGLFASYHGRLLGTLGTLSTLSFHETKNFTCGEGGALVINDASLVERAEIIRDKGTNRARFFRGQVDKYTWVGLGSSFLPSDILAAFLLAQLEGRQPIIDARRRLWLRYQTELASWADSHGIRSPVIPADREQSFHLFYLIMRTLDERQALIEHLRSRDILAVFHYQPLHLSPMGRGFGGKPGDCPVTEDLSDRLVRLPLYNWLSEADQSRVIAAILEFKG
jgi:dTDP-4-amino-4,6-dideoxygalactose transaminase